MPFGHDDMERLVANDHQRSGNTLGRLVNDLDRLICKKRFKAAGDGEAKMDHLHGFSIRQGTQSVPENHTIQKSWILGKVFVDLLLSEQDDLNQFRGYVEVQKILDRL